MENETNNSRMEPDERTRCIANRPFCVFYVCPDVPKAIDVDTIMASSGDEAIRLTAEKHKESMILHVREVGSDDSYGVPTLMDRDSTAHLSHLDNVPGARFINGKFHATRRNDETELDPLRADHDLP